MPPKKKPRKVAPPPRILSDSESDQYVSQPSQASQILGNKNRLMDMLSSQEPSQIARNSLFEEDDGFVYQRSASNGKKKQLSTPLSGLHQAIANFSSDDDSSQLDDVLVIKGRIGGAKGRTKAPQKKSDDVSAKKTNSRGPKKRSVAAKKTLTGTKNASATSVKNQASLLLSLPIRGTSRPSGTASTAHKDTFSSDDYVEQVSHHTIELADETIPKEDFRRRLLFYNRGKRVLSIGNGFEAGPHQDVEPEDYYKVMDQSALDPHRMRQLLIWCFRKRLESDKKTVHLSAEDQTAANIAKVVKEETVAALIKGDISTTWYSQAEVRPSQVLLPNRLNQANRENVELFRRKLAQLRRDQKAWHAAYAAASAPVTQLAVSAASESQIAAYVGDKRPDYEPIVNASLEQHIAHNYASITQAAPEQVESACDNLHHSLYRLARARALVERLRRDKLAGQVAQAARKYAVRAQVHATHAPSLGISTRELLRGITRIEFPETDA